MTSIYQIGVAFSGSSTEGLYFQKHQIKGGFGVSESDTQSLDRPVGARGALALPDFGRSGEADYAHHITTLRSLL